MRDQRKSMNTPKKTKEKKKPTDSRNMPPSTSTHQLPPSARKISTVINKSFNQIFEMKKIPIFRFHLEELIY